MKQFVFAEADDGHQRRAGLQRQPHEALPPPQHHVEGARLNLRRACGRVSTPRGVCGESMLGTVLYQQMSGGEAQR